MDFNDDWLIYYVHLNNKSAYLLIKEKYQSIIRIMIAKLMIHKQILVNDYEDILDECLLILEKAIYGYRNESGTFYAYMKIIITNYVYAYNRKRYQNRNKLLLEADLGDENPTFELLSDNVTLNNLYNYYDLFSLILNESDTLLKQVIYYRILGYSYEIIAAKLNITKKKVDNLLSELKKRYSKIL